MKKLNWFALWFVVIMFMGIAYKHVISSGKWELVWMLVIKDIALAMFAVYYYRMKSELGLYTVLFVSFTSNMMFWR